MEYVASLVIQVALFASLAVGLNLLVGTAGLFSVSHALFFGIGAYATAFLMVVWKWPFLATLPVAVVVAAGVSLAISFVSLRVSGDYLIIGSFGLQLIGTSVFLNWEEVTNGPIGIAGVPYPSILGWQVDDSRGMVVVALVVLAVTSLVVGWVMASPMGRALRAVRDDDVAARIAGKDAVRLKVEAYVLAGGLAGMTGAAYATYISFVNPSQFAIDQSILLLAIIIVGGLGTVRGALIGTVLLILLPEGLRALPLSDAFIGPGQQVLYGLALVMLAFLRPMGLAPDRMALSQLHASGRSA